MGKARARVRPTREETRERVLDGAARAFATKGFEGASIDEICRLAGLTRGAFYSSFPSKEDLFFALYDRMLAEVQGRLAKATERLTPEMGVAGAMASIVSAYPIDRDWFLLISEFYLYALRNPELAPRFADYRANILDAIEASINKILTSSNIETDIENRKIARMILALHEGNFSQSEMEPDALARGELLYVFCPLIAEGMQSRSKIKERT